MYHAGQSHTVLMRKDDRVILHFDYDCFYASVFEAERPELKALPLAVQQKHIIVTCNYEARRRGLYKLQLITEAKKACPDVIIVLGEDLTRFRDASKTLYNFIRSFSWNDRAEKLGFDEVFLDVSDVIDYNFDILNKSDLKHSYFHLSRNDPTVGFEYDAARFVGHLFPSTKGSSSDHSISDKLTMRLLLGSHMAMHIREQLDDQLRYTATVGISTSKLLSKLVGNVNKPRRQTTLIPPYEPDQHDQSNVLTFLDNHDIGAIPGIGFKLAQKIRAHALGRPAEYSTDLVWGGTREKVKVSQVRRLPELSPELLENLLGGAGSPHGIGLKIFGLIHGIDDTEVGQARDIPRQISIEDSYIRLDTMEQAVQQLRHLSARLILRMRVDLTEDDSEPLEPVPEDPDNQNRRWIGRPETLRLSTRARLPLNDDGTRPRTFKRLSRSADLPRFVFNFQESPEVLAEKLVEEALLPLFRKLHPEKNGWNLSLVNVAVTDMATAGGSGKTATGRDITKMFKRQNEVLADFKITDEGGAAAVKSEDGVGTEPHQVGIGIDEPMPDAKSLDSDSGAVRQSCDDETYYYGAVSENDSSVEVGFRCPMCGLTLPMFAQGAHSRYHSMEE